MRLRGLRSGLAVAAAVWVLPLYAVQAQAGPALASQASAVWMLSTTALQNVIPDPTVAQGLSNATVYQVSDSISDNTPVTSNAILAYHEYGEAQTVSDVTSGSLSPHTGAIVLDQEDWQGKCPGGGTCTPAYDMAHPIGAAMQAAQAVQTHNQEDPTAPLTLIVTPGLDLFNNGALGCTSGTIAQCYLNYNMAGRMAAIPGVAVIDLQAQSLEGDPGTAFNSAGSYWNFVYQAAAQARAGAANAGKSIVILAGLSTHPNVTPTPTLCNIEQSANNVQSSLVSGFWMNIPDGNYAEAEQAMTEIMASGSCS